MKYETIHNILTRPIGQSARSLTLPKIGFGTWSIGGESSPDPKTDPASMTALLSALEIGYTHFDTAEYYANGHAEELIGHAVRETKTKRENLFITSKVSPEHLNFDAVLKSCENSLRRLNMEYIDLYLVHWPRVGMKLEETFRALNKLVRDGKVRNLGVSNFNLKLLKQSQSYSETPIVTDQVPYSLPNHTYVDNGVVEYCQQSDILITAYSPVKFRSIRVNKTLMEIAKTHSATPFQIALAWLIIQPRVITIPMSFNPKHIKENFDAAEIILSTDEISRLTNAWKKEDK
jgi:diketogulonate reductase-like aldo/keto reductase